MRIVFGCVFIATLGLVPIQAAANQEVRLGQIFCEALDRNISSLVDMAGDRGILMPNMKQRYLRIHLYERGSLDKNERSTAALSFMTAKLFDPFFSVPGYKRENAYRLAQAKCAASNENPDRQWLELIGREVFRATGELEAWIEDNRLPYGENEERALEFCEKLDYSIEAIPRLAKKFGVTESLVPATLMEGMASTMVPHEDVKWIMANFRLAYEAFYRGGRNGELKENVIHGCEKDLVFIAEVLDSNRQALYNDAYLSGFSFFTDSSFNAEGSMEEAIFERMCESPGQTAKSIFDSIKKEGANLSSFAPWALSVASEGNGFAMYPRDEAGLVAISAFGMLTGMVDMRNNLSDASQALEWMCSQGEGQLKKSLRLMQSLFEKRNISESSHRTDNG